LLPKKRHPHLDLQPKILNQASAWKGEKKLGLKKKIQWVKGDVSGKKAVTNPCPGGRGLQKKGLRKV